MMQRYAVTALFAALALSACSKDTPSDEAQSTATGEVLEGSISDAMIPLEAVQTKAQLAPPTAQAASAGGTTAQAGSATDAGSAGETAAASSAAGSASGNTAGTAPSPEAAAQP